MGIESVETGYPNRYETKDDVPNIEIFLRSLDEGLQAVILITKSLKHTMTLKN